ncbi:hypothetical protein [Streptomyces cellostaticus]|nr:hypothetical protein [Streptomyces cellostaticus]
MTGTAGSTPLQNSNKPIRHIHSTRPADNNHLQGEIDLCER